MMNNLFARMKFSCQWKGTIIAFVCVISIGLVQVVGVADGENFNETLTTQTSLNLNKMDSDGNITNDEFERAIWKVTSSIALVECLIGVISNSLLLLLTYINPLNNLRKSSWITITNLAAADLLTSIFVIPFCHPVYEITLKPTGSDSVQYIFVDIFRHIGYAGSFFFLLLFSIERYIAIKRPFEIRTILTRKRVFLACILCWAAAIGCSLLIIAFSVKFLIALYGILELSLLIMIVFQILIVRGIKEASLLVEGGEKRKAVMKNISTTGVVLILVLMVTAFPYFIAKQVEFYYRADPNVFNGKMASVFPYYYFPVACINFIINPFIYALRLPDYRNAFVALLKRTFLCSATGAQRNSPQFALVSRKDTVEMTPC